MKRNRKRWPRVGMLWTEASRIPLAERIIDLRRSREPGVN
jgi:hypothetical protein